MVLDQALQINLSTKVRDRLGFHFPESKFDELWKRMQYCLPALNLEANEEGVTTLLSWHWDERVIDKMVPYLTIGETYFFRDPRFWDHFQSVIVPELIKLLQSKARYEIAIWSAACSTGEEPYTIAMLLQQILPPELRVHFKIYASDLNRSFIDNAQKGLYPKWSMRAIPDTYLNRFFTENQGKFQLSKEIRDSVRFFQHNLVEHKQASCIIPLKFDLILCRNVLMYFESEQIKQVIEKLGSQLYEGSCMVLSPQDLWHANECLDLETISYTDLMLLRRRLDPSMERHAGLRFQHEIRGSVQTIAGAKNDLSASKATTPDGEMRPAVQAASPGIFQEKLHEELPISVPLELLVKLGKFAQAAEQVRQRIEAGANTEENLKFLVQFQINQGDLSAALISCDKAIKSYPLSPSFYYLKSSLLQELGDLSGAIKVLQQAIFLEPDFIIAHFALFNLYRKLGKESQEMVSYKNVVRLLEKVHSDQTIPESDGLTAAQLLSVIKSGVNRNH